MQSHTTTFTYSGKEHTLDISVYHAYSRPGKSSKHSFGVRINDYFAGYIVRNSEGIWHNLDAKPNHVNLPFPLGEKHYQRIGRLIEEHLSEWV